MGTPPRRALGAIGWAQRLSRDPRPSTCRPRPRNVSSPQTIEAAGGIVCRTGDAGVEVAIVHRPRYDDWSLPKGKLDIGEPALAAAVRGVREEIGVGVVVSRRVGTARYTIGESSKRVTYWAMRYRSGQFSANDEVAAVDWLPLGDAAE